MLEWTISAGRGCQRIRFKGAITEATSFDELEIAGDRVVLVTDGVRYVNSTGLQRLWQFIEPLRTHCHIVIERCSPAIVAQLNMMPALADCVEVMSLIAPLECVDCIAEMDVLLPIAGSCAPDVPARRCEVCGGDMVLAEQRERYFAFLG
jgi:anti-anti-sigma regulatory factor